VHFAPFPVHMPPTCPPSPRDGLSPPPTTTRTPSPSGSRPVGPPVSVTDACARAASVPPACPCMRSCRIVPWTEGTTDDSYMRGSHWRRSAAALPTSVRLPPLVSVMQAVSLSPYRPGVAERHQTRLRVSSAFPTCACPFALLGSGESCTSKSSPLHFGHLGWQFTPCVPRRTVSWHTAPP